MTGVVDPAVTITAFVLMALAAPFFVQWLADRTNAKSHQRCCDDINAMLIYEPE
ncbi:MAG: hypothetical protein AAF662_10060 [Pseudomonadota bacterium]